MKYLLDVNVLIAWGWQEHADHERVSAWIARERKQPSVRFLTSAIPELGFVRVSVQRAAGEVEVSGACSVLEAMLGGLGKSHAFVSDDRRCIALPAWCKNAARTTDAHLLALADAHGAKLATLDVGIPGAFMLPE